MSVERSPATSRFKGKLLIKVTDSATLQDYLFISIFSLNIKILNFLLVCVNGGRTPRGGARKTGIEYAASMYLDRMA